MKLELNYYKESGKWYTTEIKKLPTDYNINDIIDFVKKKESFKGMTVTVHIIEPDEFKQPYRFFRL